MSRRAAIAAAALTGALSLSGCGEATVPAHLRIANADPARGRALIYGYGCGLCHTIDGIRGADGTVGPPLKRYAQQNLVAGILPNTPPHLIAWLTDPPAIEPRTGMPDMDISEAQARDIAAYLYTTGAAGAQVYPPDPPLALQGRGQPVLQSEYPSSGGYQGSSGSAGAGKGPRSIDESIKQFARGAQRN
jgi:mono/diheme cytochrome c family protein